MKWYVYIISDTNKKHYHTGFTHNIKWVINFYNEMPSLLPPWEKQNRLVYLEESDAFSVRDRFLEICSMAKPEVHEMINKVNPEWVELIPGENIEL